MTTEPEMCPCGCGLEREVVIRSMMDLMGWSREHAEWAVDGSKADK